MNLMVFGYLKAPFVEAPLFAGGLRIEEGEALKIFGNTMTVMNPQDREHASITRRFSRAAQWWKPIQIGCLGQ